jgi:hypothetical protein
VGHAQALGHPTLRANAAIPSRRIFPDFSRKIVEISLDFFVAAC